jgi:diguanylate cyclase (GGDEF)-like protein
MDLKTLTSSLAARLKDGPSGLPPLQQVIADHFDGLVVVDETEQVIAASGTACALLGRASLVGLSASRVLPLEMLRTMREIAAAGVTHTSSPLAVAVLREGSGDEERLVAQYVVTLSPSPAGTIACVSFWDVTERRRAEEKLNFLASHDPLTGAFSRTGFCSELNRRFETERGRDEGMAAIAIDLNRFKPVNDALGHAYGDMLLKQVVSRLRATGAAYVARLGGHGFSIGHPGLSSPETAQFCELLEQRLIEPYSLGPHRAIIGADIGYTHTSMSGFDPEVLLSHADMALSMSRTATAKGYVAFSAEMDEQLRERHGTGRDFADVPAAGSARGRANRRS